MITRDADGDVIDANATLFATSEPPREETRLPPWAYGWRRRLFVEAVEELSELIAGERSHPGRPQLRREERFASVGHALATLVVVRIDGPSHGRGPGETLLQIARYQCRIQWSSKAAAPAPLDLAEDLVHVERALHNAYAELPYMCPLLRGECELALLARETARKSPTEIASVFGERLTTEVSARQVGRVTRWGHQRAYEYLRERGMVPAEEVSAAKGGVDMANPGGYDLEGWAQIAGYLGVHEKTAREWADDEHMPVLKIRGRVYAKREAIAAWWESLTVRPGAA